MNTQHTPGPWTAVDGGRYIQSSREHGVNTTTQHDLDICRLDYENNMLAGERVANARLIAAAPDLLAALRTLVELEERGQPPGTDDIATGRAAIAKAEAE